MTFDRFSKISKDFLMVDRFPFYTHGVYKKKKTTDFWHRFNIDFAMCVVPPCQI